MEDELVKRATRAYLAHCRKRGFVEQQPGIESDFDPKTGLITLRNTNGVLSIYRYDKQLDRISFDMESTHKVKANHVADVA